MRGAAQAARPLTDADYRAVRAAAIDHLVCTVCGRTAHRNEQLGERHVFGCAGVIAVRPGNPDPPWAHVWTSYGDGVVVATADPDRVDVYLVPSAGFASEAPLRAAELLARGVLRVRRSEAEEEAFVESLCDQRDNLCLANTDLGVLLVCMTLAVGNRRESVAGLDPLGLATYLEQTGWSRERLHGSGNAWVWWRGRESEPRLLEVHRPLGDYLERTWEMLVALGRFEERDPTVILAYLMARDVERERARRWAEPEGPPGGAVTS